jgi:xanthine dehydrogenase accessory factor
MKDLLPEIHAWLAAGEEVAVATVVHVAGSAPRPAGACMAVSSTGKIAGSVSGGCVEAAVYQELMTVLLDAPPHVVQYGISDDMLWDVGLACGGTIDVFVQRLDPALVYALQDLLGRRIPVALATLLRGAGAAGTWALVTTDGPAAGYECPLVTQTAQQSLAARSEIGELVAVEPDMELFIQTLLPAPVLLVAGAVHVAIPLVRFARLSGFYVIVVDPRAQFATRSRFAEADEIWVEWPDQALAHLAVDEQTYIVLLTHDPKIDDPALAAALSSNAAYVGAIGSRRTQADRIARMADSGFDADAWRRLHTPIGLDLGGHTPEETALSIIAEVVAVRNHRSGRPLRDGNQPHIHATTD